MFILATTGSTRCPPPSSPGASGFPSSASPRDIAARLLLSAGREQIDLTADGAELLSRLADGAPAGRPEPWHGPVCRRRRKPDNQAVLEALDLADGRKPS